MVVLYLYLVFLRFSLFWMINRSILLGEFLILIRWLLSVNWVICDCFFLDIGGCSYGVCECIFLFYGGGLDWFGESLRFFMFLYMVSSSWFSFLDL